MLQVRVILALLFALRCACEPLPSQSPSCEGLAKASRALGRSDDTALLQTSQHDLRAKGTLGGGMPSVAMQVSPGVSSALRGEEGASAPCAAFCISGHPRSFVVPAVHLSLQRNLIEAFGAPVSHVFWFLRIGRDARTMVELEAARRVLRPTREVYDSTPGHEVAHSPRWSHAEGCPPNVAGQEDSIHRCFELVQDDERHRGVQYGFLFRLRPDLLWVRRFPSFAEYSTGGWSGVSIIWDLVEVTDSKWARAVFSNHAPCNTSDSVHEVVMTTRLLMSGAPVRYQSALRDEITGPNFGQGRNSKWQDWPCEWSAVIVRLADHNGTRVIRCDSPTHTGPDWFVSSECTDLLGLSEADAQRRVDLWHTRRSCGGGISIVRTPPA